MSKKIESTQALFKRPALLEGSRNGKMPVSAGKWVWPYAVIALILGTAWGTNHIEQQVHHAAPQILAEAGIKSSAHTFKTSYRTVDVSGVDATQHSRSNVEAILANYDGSNGVNIRNANVSVVARSVASAKPAIQQRAAAELPLDNVRVSAVVDKHSLTLSGTVPSRDHVDLLVNAAQQKSQGLAVINILKVSGTPLKNKDVEESINDLAMVMANFDTNIVDAHLDVDNDLLTGNITTASKGATDKVRAYLPSQLISIITNEGSAPVASLVTPVSEPAISEPAIPEPIIPEPMIREPLIAETVIPLQQTSEQYVATLNNTPPVYETPAVFQESQYLENQYLENQFPENQLPENQFQQNQITSLQSEIDLLENAIRDQVIFAPGSTVLTASATAVLDDITNALNTYPDTSVEVSGHTDSLSSAQSNLALSNQRAKAVVNYIASLGIANYRLTAIGLGETHPIASNDTKAGRALNRRVEFRAY